METKYWAFTYTRTNPRNWTSQIEHGNAVTEEDPFEWLEEKLESCPEEEYVITFAKPISERLYVSLSPKLSVELL